MTLNLRRVSWLIATLLCVSSSNATDASPESDASSSRTGDWERIRRADNRENPESVRSMLSMLDDAFGRVAAARFEQLAQDPPTLSIQLVASDFRAIYFQTRRTEYSGGTRWKIRTTPETLSTITKINIAARLSQIDAVGPHWLAQYLLYLRRVHDDDIRVDPLRAMGLIDNQEPTGHLPESGDAVRLGIEDTRAMLTFLIAHEVFHVLHPFYCRESGTECLERRRADELSADMFALDTMRLVGEQYGDAEYQMSVPTQVFLRLLIVIGDDSAISTHPPHVERVRSANTALREWLTRFSADPTEKADLNSFADGVDDVVERVLTEGASTYYAGLDEEAIEVVIDHLRLY